MKKIITIVIYILLVLVSLEMVANYIYNEYHVACYNRKDYTGDFRPLVLFNWNEPYIVYYNQGNIYYQDDNYVEAASYYDKALKYQMPKERECAVRINYALTYVYSLLKTPDYDSPDNIDTSIATLMTAKNILHKKGCATNEGDGHSEDAQQLSDEIDALIEQLQQKKEEDSDPSQQKENENPEEKKDQKDKPSKKEEESTQEDSEEAKKEQDIEEKIKEVQRKANEERQSELNKFKGANYNFDLDGNIW